jgi:trans-aconitate methyltransferase
MPPYQWDAQDYEKNSAQQRLWAQELIRKLELCGDETVLDVGCGDGKVTAEIAACVPAGRVVGIDLSGEMISLAQSRFPAGDYSNLRFQQEDASRLPFEGEFDVVFSNATLHWLRDHRPALQSIARSLKPGGKILLQMGGKGNAAGIVAVIEELIRQPQWSSYFAGFGFPYGFYTPQEYQGWLLAVGLQPTRLELIPKDMLHPGAAGLAGWLRTTWLPYTQRLPQEKRSVFIDALVEAYTAKHPSDAQGNLYVSMVRLEVEALKPPPFTV